MVAMKKRRSPLGIACMLMLGHCAAFAVSPEQLGVCATIQDDGARLSCYDGLALKVPVSPAGPEPLSSRLTPELASAEVVQENIAAETLMLSRHWELAPEHQHGVFSFRPHRENYLVATYNRSPNEEPYRPFRFLVPGADRLSRTELAFQLSFKLKLAEDLGSFPADLWFGYSQHSYWQASNREASSPFRETNYQPEVMAVLPINIDLAGLLRLQLISAGIIHQSNGQASSLSRSWDRVYLQAGLGRENFTLLARVWERLGEDLSEDDNPDIIRYMGRGDLLANYYRNGHEYSLLARYNFSTGKGAGRLGWSFPLASNLDGYVQYFAGYGYSLIDYNAFQRVLGVGVTVDF
jgi:phospholipase A1